MNMNKITYGSRTITDEDLAIGGSAASSLMLYQALISEELKPDTFSFNLIYDKNKMMFLLDSDGKYLTDSNGKYLLVKADDFDPEEFRFGDTLKYYINNGSTLVGQFYVQTVRRVEKKIYHFECTSAIGMTTYYGHNGGIYNGESLGTVIADIMGTLPYTIDADLADVTCTGWLPKVKAARDNLRALLFMSGGSVKKNPNGTVNFGYIGSGTVKTIQDTNLNTGASISYLEPATRVEVTSHEYHALPTDETVVLYDNTNGVAATSLVVDFGEPCHDLVPDGLTIEDSGANYAIVSGVGTLSGQKYTHSTSLYAIDTGSKGEPNVIQVTDNCMINPGNVANATKRIANYYGLAKEVDYLIRVTNERPGDQVTFKDPWGDQQTGFIKEMNVTLSKRLNANTKIALNWTPGPFGDSYSNYRIFRASDITGAGRLNIPAVMQGAQALIVLLSGAGGGQAGYDGHEGYVNNTWIDYMGLPANGGEGGDPGQPGERGRIYSVYENALPAYYDNASIGVGGPGGASNGELGQPGGDTTLGTYSTADGVQLIDDYTNFLTGDAYGTMNVAGEAGEAGGIGAGVGNYDGTSSSNSTKGEDHVCADGEWTGGNYDNGHYWRERVSSGTRYCSGPGAGGGGAAHGADGGDAQAAYDEDNDHTVGGAGANAVAPAKAADTQCGHGGNGGGGGGGATSGRRSHSWNNVITHIGGEGGPAGLGSEGGQGGDGLIIIYYNPAA